METNRQVVGSFLILHFMHWLTQLSHYKIDKCDNNFDMETCGLNAGKGKHNVSILT